MERSMAQMTVFLVRRQHRHSNDIAPQHLRRLHGWKVSLSIFVESIMLQGLSIRHRAAVHKVPVIIRNDKGATLHMARLFGSPPNMLLSDRYQRSFVFCLLWLEPRFDPRCMKTPSGPYDHFLLFNHFFSHFYTRSYTRYQRS